MKIYTKSGDNGETVLLNGKRVAKSEPIVEVLGCFDELNASLGLLHTFRNKEIRDTVIDLQKDLFLMASNLVEDSGKVDYKRKTEKLEKLIDKLDKKPPKLNNFILPGGSRHAAQLHFSRALARRLERRVTAVQKDYDHIPKLMKYLNRLSDLLFVMARYANLKLGIKEIIWNKKKEK